jgi:hypothetical protein
MRRGETIKVRFSTVEEFLEELHHDHLAVEDQIVRVTCNDLPSPWQHYGTHPLNVIAGFVAHGKLIALEYLVGILILNEPERQDNALINAHAEKTIQKIEAAVQNLRLKPRRGIFEI